MKDRLDEAWQSIKYGLVRGLSIGFKDLESEPIKGSTWGRRIKKWSWLELMRRRYRREFRSIHHRNQGNRFALSCRVRQRRYAIERTDRVRS